VSSWELLKTSNKANSTTSIHNGFSSVEKGCTNGEKMQEKNAAAKRRKGKDVIQMNLKLFKTENWNTRSPGSVSRGVGHWSGIG